MMNDAPDFLSTTNRLILEAQALGATFHADGTWSMADDHPPLPSTLADRLRVHRSAVAALFAEGEIEENKTEENK
ncbi:hypothetical protein [Telmatospirillum siberiense]|uniref:Uncharacterized protein n=1 Tax=Telmatospirillum siberiense TaxID=382514 RepID=A0A2N3PS30_9PROT|nr:hypothetical protein [Telmatospirillum siberiense]PKU23213.1 hypothetical protein CWS72_17445 [Telmatospirillum siberiense]